MRCGTTIPDSALARSACSRLLTLPAREQETLRKAVEAEARRRRFLHRTRADARPTPHPIALTPFVIPGRLIPTLRRLARAVHRFQAHAPRLYLDRVGPFRELCPLDEATEGWLVRYGGRGSEIRDLLIRLDVGLSTASQGVDLTPVLFETNATALAGLFNHSVGVEVLRRLVLPRLFAPSERRALRDPPDLLKLTFNWVTESARHLGLRRRGRLGVAFVEPSGPGEGYSEIPQIAAYFKGRGVLASCGDPGELRLRAGQVFLRGHPVHIVYRDIPFGDLGTPPHSERHLAGFVELLKRRAVIPGFSGEFDHKAILECLTSRTYRWLFSAQETRVLARCVPWTRVLLERKTESPAGAAVDLLRYASVEKDRLLIKPNRGSGGEGVMVGRESSSARWERRLERAVREAGEWVVQEWVPTAQRPMAYLQNGQIHVALCYASVGLFYVRDELGLHCRVSRVPVVNVARGGALACVFVAS